MRRTLPALLAVLALLTAACSDDAGDDTAASGDGTTEAGSEGALTVYSGRSEELVGPLLESFEDDTGIEVEVRYGDTAEMAATIIEEGDSSPADVYYGQDAGALGALSEEGLLAPLDEEVIGVVDEQFRSVEDDWVGTSGRARVVAYNTAAVSEEELPDSILGYTDPEWSGRLGWAPTNGSFQAFVTALRVLEGEEGARAWLEGMEANDIATYENNTAIVDAVAAGEIDAGFVNHYYLYRLQAEGAPVDDVANKFYTDGDPGALINVAGVAVIESTDQRDAAVQLVEYLLSEESQRYFATETYEIPLVEGVEADPNLPELSSLTQPDIDLNELDDLQGTLDLLTEVGIL